MCKITRITTATVNASLSDLHINVRETVGLVVEGSIPQSPSSFLRADAFSLKRPPVRMSRCNLSWREEYMYHITLVIWYMYSSRQKNTYGPYVQRAIEMCLGHKAGSWCQWMVSRTPRRHTALIESVSEMFAMGSPSTSSRSARAPGTIWPRIVSFRQNHTDRPNAFFWDNSLHTSNY